MITVTLPLSALAPELAELAAVDVGAMPPAELDSYPLTCSATVLPILAEVLHVAPEPADTLRERVHAAWNDRARLHETAAELAMAAPTPPTGMVLGGMSLGAAPSLPKPGEVQSYDVGMWRDPAWSLVAEAAKGREDGGR